MRTERLLWAVAVSGMRIANAFSFVLLVAFIGTVLGAIEGHPLLSVWLMLPLLATLIFENLWITGHIRSAVISRIGGAAGLIVVAVLATRLSVGTGFTAALTALVAFLGIIALTALGRPIPMPTSQ